jgi:hypothetical protein
MIQKTFHYMDNNERIFNKSWLLSTARLKEEVLLV